MDCVLAMRDVDKESEGIVKQQFRHLLVVHTWKNGVEKTFMEGGLSKQEFDQLLQQAARHNGDGVGGGNVGVDDHDDETWY
jgi:hypothetical protein